MIKSVLDFDFEEFKNFIVSLGEKSFRAEQIFTAAHAGKQFCEMSNVPKSLVEKLSDYPAQAVTVLETFVGADAKKYLIKLCDGNLVEAVFMKHSYGNTVCVSTEVGCPMGCVFCASGINGLTRKMTAGEMLSTIALINRQEGGNLKERAVTNVVMMGMGEPLDNFDESVKFVRLISAPKGLNVSPRNISLSTAGLAPQILQLAETGLPVNLTVSLHAPTDELRDMIMPINKVYNIKSVLDACRVYFDKTGRRINIEYIMIDGLNSSNDVADSLIKLLRGLPCHLNLINLNRVEGKEFQGVSRTRLDEFLKRLEAGGLSVTTRRSMGGDIEGACGQLKRRYESGQI